jgi:hypothetical protein
MLTPPELVEMIEASTAERKDLLPWVKYAVFGKLTRTYLKIEGASRTAIKGG